MATEPAGCIQDARCEVRNLTPHPLATHSLGFPSAEAEAAARQRLRSLHDRQIIRIADLAEASDDTAYIGFAFWALVTRVLNTAPLSRPQMAGQRGQG
jgi:hypothetical protein